MRKRRRERIEKESREGIEKETKRQFEEKEGLRDHPPPPPPLLEFLDLCIIKKKCHGVKPNAKKCAIGETECNEI